MKSFLAEGNTFCEDNVEQFFSVKSSVIDDVVDADRDGRFIKINDTFNRDIVLAPSSRIRQRFVIKISLKSNILTVTTIFIISS
jgi:hypothetical protein